MPHIPRPVESLSIVITFRGNDTQWSIPVASVSPAAGSDSSLHMVRHFLFQLRGVTTMSPFADSRRHVSFYLMCQRRRYRGLITYRRSHDKGRDLKDEEGL